MDPFCQPRLFFKRVNELLEQNQSFAVATVTMSEGSTPRKSGAKMIVFADGTIEGTVGGGIFEEETVKAAQNSLRTMSPAEVTVDLSAQGGKSMCGGAMKAYIEPYNPNPWLIIFGAGHVGQAFIKTFAGLGFRLAVVEEYAPELTPETAPLVDMIIPTFDTAQMGDLPFGANTWVVVCTRGHAHDLDMAKFAVTKDFAYLGIIGSRSKSDYILSSLRAVAPDQDRMAKVYTPIGLPIGSQTPAEIAVSLAAQIIALQHDKKF